VTIDQGASPASYDPAGPTAYPDINDVLRDLLPRIRAALGANFRGMYLVGSLVTGDFDAGRSDVDVLVVTDAVVSDGQFAALQAVHRDLAASDSPWAIEVEAYYLTRAALRPDDPSFGEHRKVNRGGGVLEPPQRDPGWLVQAHLLREYGVALAGPDPRTLVAPVAAGDLRRTVAASTPEWLEALLADPARLRHRGPQTYIVLTLCRVLYTLVHDAVASKQAAARWAQAALDKRWTALIGRALAWRKDLPATPSPTTTEGDVAATLELIQYVLARCRDE
jgi:hypothetical protein